MQYQVSERLWKFLSSGTSRPLARRKCLAAEVREDSCFPHTEEGDNCDAYRIVKAGCAGFTPS